MYAVGNLKEAQFIVDTLKKRAKQEETLKQLELGDDSGELKKSIGKLSKFEKRRIKAGDKTVIFHKLGIIEEEDINKLKRKFGIKTKEDENNIDEILDSKSNVGRRKSKWKLQNEDEIKTQLKDMIKMRNENKEIEKTLTEEELLDRQKEKAKI